MKGGRDGALLIGTVLVGLVLAAIVFFLAISPKLASAQEAKEQTQAQIEQNDLLDITLLQRQKSAESVPEITREILTIREVLPPEEDVPSMRRLINDVMTTYGYTIESDSVSAPVVIAGGLSLQAQMEQVGLTSEVEGMLFTTLKATPFTVEALGPARSFGLLLEGLRSAGGRYVYITTLTTAADTAAGPGGIRATIGGVFFTLDNGVPGITKKPDERPWPGTEDPADPEWTDPFGTIAPSAAG